MADGWCCSGREAGRASALPLVEQTLSSQQPQSAHLYNGSEVHSYPQHGYGDTKNLEASTAEEGLSSGEVGGGEDSGCTEWG